MKSERLFSIYIEQMILYNTKLNSFNASDSDQNLAPLCDEIYPIMMFWMLHPLVPNVNASNDVMTHRIPWDDWLARGVDYQDPQHRKHQTF